LAVEVRRLEKGGAPDVRGALSIYICRYVVVCVYIYIPTHIFIYVYVYV